MITADEIKKAYEALEKASEKQYEAEENRIASAIARDLAYVAEMNEASIDGGSANSAKEMREGYQEAA